MSRIQNKEVYATLCLTYLHCALHEGQHRSGYVAVGRGSVSCSARACVASARRGGQGMRGPAWGLPGSSRLRSAEPAAPHYWHQLLPAYQLCACMSQCNSPAGMHLPHHRRHTATKTKRWARHAILHASTHTSEPTPPRNPRCGWSRRVDKPSNTAAQLTATCVRWLLVSEFHRSACLSLKNGGGGEASAVSEASHSPVVATRATACSYVGGSEYVMEAFASTMVLGCGTRWGARGRPRQPSSRGRATEKAQQQKARLVRAD